MPDSEKNQRLSPDVQQELEEILSSYEANNCTAWDIFEDGNYERREPLFRGSQIVRPGDLHPPRIRTLRDFIPYLRFQVS